MNLDSLIMRCSYVVDKALRKKFPKDYYNRCFYSSLGLQFLLKKSQVETSVIGGNFSAFMVAYDDSEARVVSYQNRNTGQEFAHYWLEVDENIVDLGAMYISISTNKRMALAPIIMWSNLESIPCFLNYEAKIKHDKNAEVMLEVDFQTKVDDFLKLCDEKYRKLLGQPKSKYWLLKNRETLRQAARRADKWAIGALRFEAMQ